MDPELVAFLFVGGTILFAILAVAKDREGKRYGVRRMALMWCAALPYFLSSVVEFSAKHADGSTETAKITYSTWFLLILPIHMIATRLAEHKKADRPSATATLGDLGSGSP